MGSRRTRGLERQAPLPSNANRYQFRPVTDKNIGRNLFKSGMNSLTRHQVEVAIHQGLRFGYPFSSTRQSIN